MKRLQRAFWNWFHSRITGEIAPPIEERQPERSRETQVGADAKPVARPQESTPPKAPPEVHAKASKLGFDRKAKDIRVTVGLDFGTSATKAVWRRHDTGKVQAIIFRSDEEGDLRFALPAVVGLDDSGLPVLGYEAKNGRDGDKASRFQHHLKVLLAGKYNSGFRDEQLEAEFDDLVKSDAPWVTAGLAEEYFSSLLLANSMAESRAAVLRHFDSASAKIDITFNVGIPIDHRQCDDIWRAWAKVIACAEQCERNWAEFKNSGFAFKNWAEIWKRADYGHGEDDPTDRVDQFARAFAVPEAVAALDSFLESLAVRPGMYALVDVGSGTTDLSIVRVSQARARKWLSSRVVSVGCRQWEAMRNGNGSVSVDREFAQTLWNALQPLWAKTYREKLREEGEWHNVRVFVTGGGSQIESIRQVLGTPWWEQLRRKEIRFRVSALPAPEELSGAMNGMYYRMAVAHGLTKGKPEFGVISLPNETPDQTPPKAEPPDDWNDGEGKPNPHGWV